MLQTVTYLFVFYFFAITPYSVSAMTPEQKAMIHEHFETTGKECFKDNPITKDDIVNLRAKQMPTGDNAPCFIACVMKNTGIMDDKGVLQKESALDAAKKVFNDAEELKAIEDFIHSCSHINDEPVGDGEKGCERALKAFKCMIENASQFGLDI